VRFRDSNEEEEMPYNEGSHSFTHLQLTLSPESYEGRRKLCPADCVESQNIESNENYCLRRLDAV